MSSFNEAPIPTHDVVCIYGDAYAMGINDPASRGDYDSCAAYIASHDEPPGWEFAIRNLETGRFMSHSVLLNPKRTPLSTAHLYSLNKE